MPSAKKAKHPQKRKETTVKGQTKLLTTEKNEKKKEEKKKNPRQKTGDKGQIAQEVARAGTHISQRTDSSTNV